jgi:hypothetical protein
MAATLLHHPTDKSVLLLCKLPLQLVPALHKVSAAESVCCSLLPCALLHAFATWHYQRHFNVCFNRARLLMCDGTSSTSRPPNNCEFKPN